MSSQGLLRGFWKEGRGRWEGSWGFADVKRIVHTPSLPSLRGSRDLYKVEGLHPRFLAIIPAYPGQLLSQLGFGFF